MLGIFAVGFFLPRVGGRAALVATLVAQALVIVIFKTSTISFLWYNVIGAFALIALALVLQPLLGGPVRKTR